MTVVIEKHVHKDFIESALNNGWEARQGPWGYREDRERTVILSKPFPELGGDITIWLKDRNFGTGQWDEEAKRWKNVSPKDYSCDGVDAWHKLATGGEFNLAPELNDVLLNGLDDAFWSRLAHTCDNCGRVMNKMNHIAFANKACDDCADTMRSQMEKPGWSE